MSKPSACKPFIHKYVTAAFLHPTAILIKLQHTTSSSLTTLNELAILFRNTSIKGKRFFIEVIPAFDSLLLEWSQHEKTHNVITLITQQTTRYFNEKSQENTQTQTDPFLIPVCYCNQCALDKHHISKTLNLDFNEVIRLHTKQIYSVQAIGFIPGFAYLGDVDKKIALPRHQTPRIHVAKNSVAIGENKTAIYPSDSPGGWNIIGKTPIASLDQQLFNNNTQHPLLTVGNKIQFYFIHHQQYIKHANSNRHA